MAFGNELIENLTAPEIRQGWECLPPDQTKSVVHGAFQNVLVRPSESEMLFAYLIVIAMANLLDNL